MRRHSNDEPFGWWGPLWSPPAPRSILDLIGDGTLPAEAAALLWALLARRASIVVAAGPSGAGKTTLLTALLDFLPPDTRRVYLRGCYEPFAFLDDPAIEPNRTHLLVNEISAHLPIYLWGPGVRRTLEATRSGFGIAATAHATSVEGFVQSLAGYPLRIPAAAIAAIDLVVRLDAWWETETVHRAVRDISSLAPTPDAGGLTIDRLATRSDRDGPLALDLPTATTVAARLGGTDSSDIAREIAERTTLLSTLETHRSPPNAVANALAESAQRWPLVATATRRPSPRWEPPPAIG